MTLSAIVLTRNEERNIEDCLSSVSFADERLVVDSGSTDHTVALAVKRSARVITHPFKDFASQRNFAMSQATGDWVIFIDADERVTTELAGEIKAALKGTVPSNASEGLSPTAVYAIPRHNYFFGKRLRYGDAGNDAPIRLFPQTGVQWTQPVHETLVTNLPAKRLAAPLLHFSTRDLAHYKQKIHDYIPLELETLKTKGIRPSLAKAFFLPPAKFIQLYFLKLGILDGIAGLQYAILSAYFYTFRKYWRYWKER